MEARNYFTSISYDTVDFLIQSKYIVFGIYLAVEQDAHQIEFNGEILPHIHIGRLLENNFSCKSKENCTVVLVLQIQDCEEGIKEIIERVTGTSFPLSGNFALSVSSSISSSLIDTSTLRLLPVGIRKAMLESGICAIGFISDSQNKNLTRKQILISPDKFLKNFLKTARQIREKNNEDNN